MASAAVCARGPAHDRSIRVHAERPAVQHLQARLNRFVFFYHFHALLCAPSVRLRCMHAVDYGPESEGFCFPSQAADISRCAAGLFSYNIDSHHVQRVVGEVGLLKGCAMNEGDFELYGGTLGALHRVAAILLRAVVVDDGDTSSLLAAWVFHSPADACAHTHAHRRTDTHTHAAVADSWMSRANSISHHAASSLAVH